MLLTVCASLNTWNGVGVHSHGDAGHIGLDGGHYMAVKNDLGTGCREGLGNSGSLCTGDGLGTRDECLQRTAFSPLLNRLQCLNHLHRQPRDSRRGVRTSNTRQAGSTTAKARSSYGITQTAAAAVFNFHPCHEGVKQLLTLRRAGTTALHRQEVVQRGSGVHLGQMRLQLLASHESAGATPLPARYLYRLTRVGLHVILQVVRSCEPFPAAVLRARVGALSRVLAHVLSKVATRRKLFAAAVVLAWERVARVNTFVSVEAIQSVEGLVTALFRTRIRSFPGVDPSVDFETV